MFMIHSALEGALKALNMGEHEMKESFEILDERDPFCFLSMQIAENKQSFFENQFVAVLHQTQKKFVLQNKTN